MTTLVDSYFLVCTVHGIQKLLRTAPKELNPGEVAFPIQIEVEDEVFQPVQTPVIKMKLGANQAVRLVEGEVEGGGS